MSRCRCGLDYQQLAKRIELLELALVAQVFKIERLSARVYRRRVRRGKVAP